jgi:YegS/Rv2252/BmrU family lipid kinase
MHFKKASLIINPRTGHNVTKLPAVLAVLSAAGWKTNIALKEYGGHSMALAKQASQDDNALVIAYGGDGTLNQVVNGVMNNKKVHATVGVIPGGTANLWAGDIGVPSDPVQAALALLNSEVHKVDIGHVTVQAISFPSVDDEQRSDNQQDSKKKLKSASKVSKNARDKFLLMAGLGFDAAVMNNVSTSLKDQIGALAVGLTAAKNLPEQHPFPLEIWANGNGKDDDAHWQGEALQVIIGNTRRYAIVLQTTPEAYIDDGVLDACVITGGDPLTTIQQVSSLLLRRKPDNTTTETFHGSRLSIKVPATVPLQLDGSAIKLKDLLDKADYQRLLQATNPEQVMVTYCIEVLPRALGVTIPLSYDQSLFEHSDHNDKEHERAAQEDIPERHEGEEVPQTAQQRRTADEESQSQHPLNEEQQKQREEIGQQLSGLIDALLERGRKVTVVGKVPYHEHLDTYVIAGETQKAGSVDLKPVAVVFDNETTIFNRQGNRIPIEAVQDLQNGQVIVVQGDKNKRGVIRASRAVL